MKKLMVAIAAVASAFGLYAADPNGTSFEDMTPGGDIVQELAKDTGAGWTITPASETNINIKTYTGAGETFYNGQRPAQFTDAGVANFLDVATTFTNPVARTIGGDGMTFGDQGLYVDTLVKFTAADQETIEIPGSDAKIAVWVKEVEYADNTTTNWLMVTAGKYTGTTLDSVPVDYTIGKFDGIDAWHRLTIKAVQASGSTVKGFVVWVDGDQTDAPVWCEDAKTAFGSLTLTANAAEFCRAGQLFPSLSDFSGLKTIAIAGKGGIDDISFTQTAPSFAPDFQFAKVTWNENVAKVGDMDVTQAGETNILINFDEAFNLAYTAKSGYISGTIEVQPVVGTYPIVPAKANVEVDIGGVKSYYPTVAAALDAKKGQAFTLTLKDAITETFTIDNKNNAEPAESFVTTLDLNGQVLTGDVTNKTALVVINTDTEKEGDLFKGTITGTLVAEGAGNLLIHGGYIPNVVTENLDWNNYSAKADGGQFTFDLTAPLPAVELVTGYTAQKLDGKDVWEVIAAPTSAKLTIPTLDNVTVSATTGTPAVVIATAAGEYTVDIDAEVAVTWTATGNYFFGNNTQTTNETVTVPAAGATLTVPATQEGKVKKGTLFFISLQDALDNDAAGTITLLADTTLESAPTLTKAETIDLNGFTFTFENIAFTLGQNVTITNSKATGGLLNKAQITIAANKKLDCTTLAWGVGGLIATEDPATTTARFTIKEGAELALGAGSPAPTSYPTTGFITAENGAKYTGAGVTYYYKGGAWGDAPWAKDLDGNYILANEADVLTFKEQIEAGNFLTASFKVGDSDITMTDPFTVKTANVAASFGGTFDGNGKTITFTSDVYQPNPNKDRFWTGFFTGLADGAVVKNLTLNGTVGEYDSQLGDSYSAILTTYTYGSATFENVTIKGSARSKKNLAAFVCYPNMSTTDEDVLIFRNCTNEATITCVYGFESQKCAAFVGGGAARNVSGKTATIFFDNCVNDAAITMDATLNAVYLAAFVAQFDSNSNVKYVFNNCVNTKNGTITATYPGADGAKSGVGTFIGYKTGGDSGPTAYFTNVVAAGAITVSNTNETHGTLRVGGLIGDFSPSAGSAAVDINGAVVTGAITVNGLTASAYGFVGDVGGCTLTAEGTLKAAADLPPSGKACAGLTYATVADGVATYQATLAKNTTYTQMLPVTSDASIFTLQAVGDTFVLNTNGLAFAGTVDAADGLNVEKTVSDQTITWTAKSGATPVVPGGDQDPMTKEEAEEAAEKAVVVPPNNDVAALFTDPADYNALFVVKAVETSPGSSQYILKAELTTATSNAVQTAVSATAVAQALVETATTTPTTSVATQKGLYYGLAASGDVTTIGAAEVPQAKWVLGDGTSKTLTADKPEGTKGFYQVRVQIEPPVSNAE